MYVYIYIIYNMAIGIDLHLSDDAPIEFCGGVYINICICICMYEYIYINKCVHPYIYIYR